MTLSNLQSEFYSKLYPLYPKQEIDSIFHLVVSHLLNYSKIEFHRHSDKNISPEKEKQMLKILDRLKNAEPVQYILGKTEFYGSTLSIDKRALIPRPETEWLVDMVVKNHNKIESISILDIGTGSGCIAIALAKSFPASRITAIDISQEALELAEQNAIANKVNINFLINDILKSQMEYSTFDIIISNPPYVRNSEKQFMHRNILEFEPLSALYVSDEDALVYYRAIATFGKKCLKSNGTIYLELNEFMGKEIAGLFSNTGYSTVELHKDLNQKIRYLTAKK